MTRNARPPKLDLDRFVQIVKVFWVIGVNIGGVQTREGSFLLKRLLACLLAWVLITTTALASGGVKLADYPHSLKGKHFVVLYATSGPDAVEPSYAERALLAAEGVYEQFVTEGGLRAPRVLPVPIVIRADEPSTGGSMAGASLGYDLVLRINPRMSDGFSLEDVMAHEFFHVMQASYYQGGDRPAWAIEGSASVAPHYAFDQPWSTFSLAQRQVMGAYYTSQHRGTKTNPYLSGLFWYWLADQYGEIGFLGRVLTWAEHFEWESAIQLAAIEGGAPDATTFDGLWRRFMQELMQGSMPEAFESRHWLQPSRLQWAGRTSALVQGRNAQGSNLLGTRFSYTEPQLLPTYSYALVEVIHGSSAPFDLTVTGDDRTLEAYVIKPGPQILRSLQMPRTGGLQGPDRRPATDPATLWAPLTPGEPLRVSGQLHDRTLVLILRLGNWGNGAYSVGITPSAAATPVPPWTSLVQLIPGPHSAGSPPPLTPAELAALRDGTLLPPGSDLASDVGPATSLPPATVQLTVGARTVRAGSETIVLPAPVRQSQEGPLFPVAALAPHLGIQIEGSRYSLGSQWLVTTGQYWPTHRGPIKPIYFDYTDGHLMVPSLFFLMLGCTVSSMSDEITLTCPVK